MIIKIDLDDLQLAGLSAFLAGKDCEVNIPQKDLHFTVKNCLCDRIKLARLVSVRKNGERNVATLQVEEYYDIYREGEYQMEAERHVVVPAEFLLKLFASMGRFPLEPTASVREAIGGCEAPTY